jgi:hypothetical protein
MVHHSESLNLLYEALVKTQAEMEGAKKDSNNPHLKTKYADLESYVFASRPFLVKNGLCVLQMVNTKDDRIFLTTRLAHMSGQYIESSMEIKPSKNDMQGLGAAITYARKYSYSSIICLATEDDDGEQDRKNAETLTDDDGEQDRKNAEERKPDETLTSAQIGELEKYIEQDQNLLPLILNKANVDELSLIPRKHYNSCIQYLKNKLNK